MELTNSCVTISDATSRNNMSMLNLPITDNELVEKARKGDHHAFNDLLLRHNDLLTHKANAFRKSPMPTSVMHAHAVQLAHAAVNRYDPKSAAKFRTFLDSTIRLNRFATQHKNVARIPEHRSLLIGRYQAAKQLLEAELDREPSAVELAEYLGWSVSDAAKMDTSLSRKDLSASAMEFDQVGNVGDRLTETIDFIYYSLSPEEQLVYDYSLGKHGKPQIDKVADIVKKTGLTPDKVYAIKRSIAQRIAKIR